MTITSVNDINNQGFYVPYKPTYKNEPQAEPPAHGKGGLRDDFMWGFATASAQIEGGGKEKEIASGRGRSVSALYYSFESILGADLVDLGYAMRETWSYQGWILSLRHLQPLGAVQRRSSL